MPRRTTERHEEPLRRPNRERRALRVGRPEDIDAQDTHFVRLAKLAFQDSTERILAVAREQLDMDVAFVAEFSRDREIVRAIDGDGAPVCDPPR